MPVGIVISHPPVISLAKCKIGERDGQRGPVGGAGADVGRIVIGRASGTDFPLRRSVRAGGRSRRMRIGRVIEIGRTRQAGPRQHRGGIGRQRIGRAARLVESSERALGVHRTEAVERKAAGLRVDEREIGVGAAGRCRVGQRLEVLRFQQGVIQEPQPLLVFGAIGFDEGVFEVIRPAEIIPRIDGREPLLSKIDGRTGTSVIASAILAVEIPKQPHPFAIGPPP